MAHLGDKLEFVGRQVVVARHGLKRRLVEHQQRSRFIVTSVGKQQCANGDGLHSPRAQHGPRAAHRDFAWSQCCRCQ